MGDQKWRSRNRVQPWLRPPRLIPCTSVVARRVRWPSTTAWDPIAHLHVASGGASQWSAGRPRRRKVLRISLSRSTTTIEPTSSLVGPDLCLIFGVFVHQTSRWKNRLSHVQFSSWVRLRLAGVDMAGQNSKQLLGISFSSRMLTIYVL